MRTQAKLADMITSTSMAASLNVHRDTVRRWCVAGLIPGAVRMGVQWLVPRGSERPTGYLPEDEGLTVAAAARLAGLTRERMRQLVDRGDLPTTFTKGRRFVLRSQLDAWVAARKEAAGR